jgi:hypothetical protein
MSPSHTEVRPPDASNMTHARTTDVGSAEATDVGSAEATDVGSAEAADVTSAEATHVTSTKAAHVAATKAATMSAAATATASGLRTRRNEAAGKQRRTIIHFPFMIFLHCNGRAFRHRTVVRRWRVLTRQTPTSR